MSLHWITDNGFSYVVDFDNTPDHFAVYDAVQSKSIPRAGWTEIDISAEQKSRLFVATRALTQLQTNVSNEASITQEAIDAALSLNRWDLASSAFNMFAEGVGTYVGGVILGAGNPASGLMAFGADDMIEIGVELTFLAVEQFVLYEGVGLSQDAVELYTTLGNTLPASSGTSLYLAVDVANIERAWNLRNDAFTLSQMGSQFMFNVALDESLNESTWDTLKGWGESLVSGVVGTFIDTNTPIPVELSAIQAEILSFTADVSRLVQLGDWTLDALDLLADRHNIKATDFGALNFDRFTHAFSDGAIFPVNADIAPIPGNSAPVVTGPATIPLQPGQTITGAQLFTSVTDVNGQSDITLVKFWDSTPGAGYLTFDGIKQSVVSVPRADLGRVAYVAGNVVGTNQIIVEAFDQAGADSNDLRVTLVIGDPSTLPPVPGQAPPIVSGPASVSVGVNRSLQWWQLFGQPTDPDGNSTIDHLIVWDSTPGEGVVRDGCNATSKTILTIEDLWQLRYDAGNAAGTNLIVIEAVDAQGNHSADHYVAIKVVDDRLPADPSNHAPEVSGAPVVDAVLGETVAGSDLFAAATDQDGRSEIAFIAFWDCTPGTDGGYVTLDGKRVTKAEVAPNELARVAYVAGTQPGLNDIIIEAVDKHGADSNDLRITVRVGGTAAANVMLGTAGNDTLTGTDGRDLMLGMAGNDRLVGNNGADTLTGGTGNDTLVGDEGNDLYVFRAGDGQDTIDNFAYNSATDTVQFAGLAAGGLSALFDLGTDLVLQYGSGDQVTVKKFFFATDYGYDQNADYRIDQIQFSDTTWSLTDIAKRHNGTANADTLYGFHGLANAINGLAGNDRLVGNNGADTLTGGTGNDTLVGDEGNDLYVFRAGDGQDTIDNFAYNSATDTVQFAGLAAGELSALFDLGTDLVLQYGSGDQVTVKKFFFATDYGYDQNADYRIDQIQFSDTTWSLTDIAKRHNGTANADTLYGFHGLANAINGLAGNDRLVGNNGADTLTGGTGNDTLVGDEGNDLYVFRAGDGQDTIDNFAYNSATDTVQFAGLAAGELSALFDLGTDLVLQYGSGDQVTVKKFFFATDYGYDQNADYRIDQIQFSDTTWSLTDIAKRHNGTANADTLYGFHGLANAINGLAGNDRLVGNNGADTLTGGAGNDTLSGERGSDTYRFGPAWGSDSISDPDATGKIEFVDIGQSSLTFVNVNGNLVITDGTNQTTFSGYYTQGKAYDFVYETTPSPLVELTEGNDAYLGTSRPDLVYAKGGNDSVRGAAGNDSLYGGNGNDTLDGSAGVDLMVGQAGNDTYVVDDTGDSVTETEGQGNDLVKSTVTYTLGANVENLTLTGTAVVSGTGNALANLLTGNTAANTLNGGSGADTLIGGAGDDTYVVDNAADVVTELASQGTDSVQASVTYTLAANLERLTLTGSTAINGTGNTLANLLIGNTTANTLNGGSGTDTLIGGAGDDTYVVDNAADVVTELASEGTDAVQSSVTYTLATNVERLTLSGSGAINGTGNDLANTLTGNTAANTLSGGAGNDTLNGGSGADTLIGGAGDDTSVVDNVADVVTELASAGTDTVQASVTYTLAANVERLTLTGTSAINGTGNTLANTLTGNTAANTLNGGSGADTLIGGAGDDTYVVDNVADVVTELASQGTDTLLASVTYTLAANVERLTLTGSSAINGTGNDLANTLTGNTAANTLSGGAGNDTLNGGTGTDTLTGGAGDDTYVVDNAADVVTELVGEGTDTVQASVTYTLAANLERLTLTGTSVINGTGNDLANTLTGNTAANTLDGGTGADTLIGGAGDDTYVVDNAADVVAELASQGTDSLQASVTYTLAANLERLTLTGTSAINGTGNTLANTLTGNTAANNLNGGSGADTLIGGAGDDTYVVDNAADVVTELASQGADTVQASVSYTLAANLERLTLTGTSAINGTGNDLANTLTGNTAANTLTGGVGNDTLNGASGADTLIGGLGNDTYVLDNASDVVTELASQGTDTVQVSVTYTLAANVERLTLTGSNAINGTGNTLANLLTGNTAANTLNGGSGADTLIGGTGNDTLTGGAGADVFKFVTAGQGLDRLTDFTSATDKIQVVSANFGNLAVGTLAASRFLAAGTVLTNANAVFLHDAATGSLAFDSNGNGAGGVSRLASLTGPKTLLAGDIQVVAA